MFKSDKKIKPQSPKENYVNTYGAPVFAPDYSATGLAAEMWTNSQWAFYVCIRFLWRNSNIRRNIVGKLINKELTFAIERVHCSKNTK